MPDFQNMTASELSNWYIEVVGYDRAAEEPIALEDYRTLCAEVYELHQECPE